MGANEIGPDDFRYQAVQASRALVHRRGASTALVDLEKVGHSLCLPREGAVGRDPFPLVSSIGMFGGFALLALSLLVINQAEGSGDVNHPENPQLQLLGFILGGCGFGMMMLSLVLLLPVRQWWGRRRLMGEVPDRLFDHEGQPIPKPRLVEVEDAATHHRLKLHTEDVAVIVFEPDERRLRLDGLRCRYLIRAEDVFELAPVINGTAPSVRLGYLAAGVPVTLVFGNTGFWTELRRQLGFGMKKRLFDQVALTLFGPTGVSGVTAPGNAAVAPGAFERADF